MKKFRMITLPTKMACIDGQVVKIANESMHNAWVFEGLGWHVVLLTPPLERDIPPHADYGGYH
jgi:hypothetical protein